MQNIFRQFKIRLQRQLRHFVPDYFGFIDYLDAYLWEIHST